MSAEKTEALRLAEFCEGNVLYQPAADELRRLHAEVERLSWDSIHTCHAECQRPLCKLTRERDALLEALRAAVADWDEEVSTGRWLDAARAAIKKAEEA
jgi:hypothetical protein